MATKFGVVLSLTLARSNLFGLLLVASAGCTVHTVGTQPSIQPPMQRELRFAITSATASAEPSHSMRAVVVARRQTRSRQTESASAQIDKRTSRATAEAVRQNEAPDSSADAGAVSELSSRDELLRAKIARYARSTRTREEHAAR